MRTARFSLLPAFVLTWVCAALFTASGCDRGEHVADQVEHSVRTPLPSVGEKVSPPFAVPDDLAGLTVTWFDGAGAHVAQGIDAIPETHRARVRIDSLAVAPDKRLDPEFVYVLDASVTSRDVFKVHRADFDRWVRQAVADARPKGEVIIYGADWCSACKAAQRFFTEAGVPFEEKNIEKDPAARKEMSDKARAQGVPTSGIPVIDVYGTLTTGFDPQQLRALLARAQGFE